jgi:hypothetical protein
MPDAQEPPQSDSMPITFIIGTEVFPPVPMSSLPDMSHLHLSAFSEWLRAYHPPTRRPSGRPGEKKTRNFPPAVLLDVLEKAISQWIDDHSTGRRVVKAQVAKMIGTTYSQLHVWLKEDRVNFDDLCRSIRRKKS